MHTLNEFLARSARNHRHLCPRQVLGVRMGLLAGKLLSLNVSGDNKRLLTIVETDGCFVDGIAVVTHCSVGQRTLRVEDYGKVAATFIDTSLGKAIRLIPRNTAREAAVRYAPKESTKWLAQLIGYQQMPDEQLVLMQEVDLIQPLGKIISRAGKKSVCQACGEEVINERELVQDRTILCRPCAGIAYYQARKSTETEAIPC
jgi:formylmethanofuran dehydrogenase subunit E